jgi:arylsulfatase A-like enzyme
MRLNEGCSYRGVVVLCVLLAASVFGVGCDSRSTENASVVLIVIDTLRPDHLSQYGYRLDTSPALADFASHATRFTNAYAPAPWTLPSMASLMTGVAPLRHRALELGDSLNLELSTIAEKLQQRGYRTAGFSANLQISAVAHFNQGFDHFVDHSGKVLKYPDISQLMRGADQWFKGAEVPGPFFLYLHPMNCHGPYRVPERFNAELLGREPRVGFHYWGDVMTQVLKKKSIKGRRKVDANLLTSLTELYDTSIRYSTDRIGDLFGYLKARDLYEESLIIITSDHGEELFDHDGFSHGYTLYEEVLGVPLFVKLPGQKTSRVVDTTVSLLDLYPTILEVTGVEAALDLDGRSLFSLMSGKSLRKDGFGEPRDLFFHLGWRSRGSAMAIKRGKYKFIAVGDSYDGLVNAELLFDLESDPEEVRDLSAANPKLSRSHRQAVNRKRKAYIDSQYADPENIKEQLNLEALQALGYVE